MEPIYNFQANAGQPLRRVVPQAAVNAGPLRQNSSSRAVTHMASMPPIPADGAATAEASTVTEDSRAAGIAIPAARPAASKLGATLMRELLEKLQKLLDGGEDYDALASQICDMLAIDFQIARAGSISIVPGAGSFHIRVQAFTKANSQPAILVALCYSQCNTRR